MFDGEEKTKKAYDLLDRAYSLLDADKPEEALEIGRQLREMGFSGGFEVVALAHASMGKLDKAIKELEDGVKIVPEVCSLWGLLGNYYSDNRQFEQAFQAFEHGLACKEANGEELNYNYSLALKRSGRFTEGLDKINTLLQSIKTKEVTPELGIMIRGLKLDLLNDLECFEECVKAFDELFISIQLDEKYKQKLSMVFSSYAYALWKTKQDNQANKYLYKAIGLDKHNCYAQWLLREMNRDKDYSKAVYYRFTVEGKWFKSEQGKNIGFFTNYDVIADNEEEALELIKIFEPKEIRNTLSIKHKNILEASMQPKGVYSTSRYIFFDEK